MYNPNISNIRLDHISRNNGIGTRRYSVSHIQLRISYVRLSIFMNNSVSRKYNSACHINDYMSLSCTTHYLICITQYLICITLFLVNTPLYLIDMTQYLECIAQYLVHTTQYLICMT